MRGAIQRAEEIGRKNRDFFMPQQFKNPENPQAHRETTAQEILAQCKGKIDAFVCGVGTGGTITGVGEVLKTKLKSVQIVAVEPAGPPCSPGRIRAPIESRESVLGLSPKS